MQTRPLALEAAIEDVYRAFADVPRGKFDHCNCGCVREAYRLEVTNTPLRKIGRDAMSFFAFKSMSTWADAQAYKHYLPRIIELADPSWPGLAPTMIAKKLRSADWVSWPERLREPVRHWVDVYFDAASEGAIHIGMVDDSLAMAVMLGKDLSTLLQRWSANPTNDALSERIRYVFQREGVFTSGAFSTASFEELHDDPHIVETLRDWLLSEDTRAALLRAESLGLVGGNNYVPDLEFWWPERLR